MIGGQKLMAGMENNYQAKADSAGDFPGYGLFWLLAFLYASFAALTFQKLILPLLPELHAGHGLLHNDAKLFHNIASDMAQRITAHGWSEWRLFPDPASTANVGLLAILYTLLGPDPAWFIPFNAAAHALGAMLVYRMGPVLWPGSAGRLGGLIAGMSFLLFPSALQWYGQNHKDAFAIAGTLTILYAWLKINKPGEGKWLSRFILLAIVGSILLGLTRPYFPLIVTVALIISFLAEETAIMFQRRREKASSRIAKTALIFAVAAVAALFMSHANVYKSLNRGSNVSLSVNGIQWSWKKSPVLPEYIDKVLMNVSMIRAEMVVHGRSVGAGSMIDVQDLPDSAQAVLSYLPRALQVGLFAPFPATWAERISATRLVGAVETFFWYLAVLGIILTMLRARSQALLAGLIFCFTLIAITSFIHPNVGTLYRQRFGEWLFVMLCGTVGWASIILTILDSTSQINRSTAGEKLIKSSPSLSGMNRLASSGSIVLIITLACYLGFFARDLLLFRQVGIGEKLDALFTAMMIPMFFVAFLVMPVADAMISPFLALSGPEREIQREMMVRHLLGFLILLIGSVVVLMVLLAPQLIRLILGGGFPQNTAATSMLICFSPILLFSAWTVVGNAVLNTFGQSQLAAQGQFVVPLVTLLAMIIAGPGLIVQTAIAGMLVGTMLNMAWVMYHLRRNSIRLSPLFPSMSVLRPVLSSYRGLMFAALASALLVPMNYAFAASVASGAVSAWALASKIVVLFSGLVAVGASAVVLPHLAGLFSRGANAHMRNDATFLLFAGSWIGGLLVVAAFLFAEPLVAVAFSAGMTEAQVIDLANIIKVGVLQVPVAIAGVIVTKMAIVSGASSRILAASIAGFVCNLALNFLLVPMFGVMGVAVGALSSTILVSLGLALGVRQKIALKFNVLLTMIVSWLVWGGVCVAITSRSTAALISSLVVVMILAWVQMKTWRHLRPGLAAD
jgi:peptidoglycan biosynthesis protein MviN/MurJ (putative lipid II flippase)